MEREKFLEVKLPNCKVYLTVTEMLQLLYMDPVLYKKVLQRGKAFTRASTQRQREQQRADQYQQKKEGTLRKKLDHWDE